MFFVITTTKTNVEQLQYSFSYSLRITLKTYLNFKLFPCSIKTLMPF